MFARKESEESYPERSVVARTRRGACMRGLMATVCVEPGAERDREDDKRGI